MAEPKVVFAQAPVPVDANYPGPSSDLDIFRPGAAPYPVMPPPYEFGRDSKPLVQRSAVVVRGEEVWLPWYHLRNTLGMSTYEERLGFIQSLLKDGSLESVKKAAQHVQTCKEYKAIDMGLIVAEKMEELINYSMQKYSRYTAEDRIYLLKTCYLFRSTILISTRQNQETHCRTLLEFVQAYHGGLSVLKKENSTVFSETIGLLRKLGFQSYIFQYPCFYPYVLESLQPDDLPVLTLAFLKYILETHLDPVSFWREYMGNKADRIQKVSQLLYETADHNYRMHYNDRNLGDRHLILKTFEAVHPCSFYAARALHSWMTLHLSSCAEQLVHLNGKPYISFEPYYFYQIEVIPKLRIIRDQLHLIEGSRQEKSEQEAVERIIQVGVDNGWLLAVPDSPGAPSSGS